MKSLAVKFWHRISNFFGLNYNRLTRFIRKKPLVSFFLSLLLLLLLILAGNFLIAKVPETKKTETIKSVQIYKIGEAPKVTLQAKIEKSGVIKISALAPGVIQSINFKEGDLVKKGQFLVNMSSNYQGGNAASIQTQIAQKQYKNIKETADSQKELIQKQRDLADKSESNASQLRDITDESLQETRDLIDLNQSVADSLSQNQANLEQNNSGGVNDATILQIKSQRAQVQLGLNQLRQSLRQTEYATSNDKPPADIARIQKDIALKQLDIQQKALDLSLEISQLQLSLAQVNEATYFPASPFTAVVQRVYVKVGQNVNPGTPLLTISATDDPITAIVNLPQNLANSVSSVLPSSLFIDDQSIDLTPTFISSEATDGSLYSVIYVVPDEYSKNLTEGGNISVEIPVGLSADVNKFSYFLPLDAIYQTGSESIVLVAESDRAVSKTIILGNVFGKFVEVKSGLTFNDSVILNRNILSGDKISVSK